jgi:hypothetical protein
MGQRNELCIVCGGSRPQVKYTGQPGVLACAYNPMVVCNLYLYPDDAKEQIELRAKDAVECPCWWHANARAQESRP